MADYTGELTSTPNSGSPQDLAGHGTNGSAGRLSTNGSGSSYPPAHQRGGGPAHTPGHHPAEPVTDGLIQILTRQWHVVVLTTIIALMLGVGYLLMTPLTYSAVSRMKVEPMDPTAMGGSNAGQNDVNDYLETECATIKSSVVLALAVDKIRESDAAHATHTLRGVDRPLQYLNQNVDASIAKSGKLIEVTFDSRYQDSAVVVVNAVVDSYREYNSNSWSERAKSVLGVLQQGQDEKERQMTDIQARMLEIAKQVGHAPNIDAGKDPAHVMVESLREVKMKATLERIDAHNAAQEAGNAVVGHPDMIKALDEAERNSIGASADPQAQLKTLQDELLLEQAKLEDAERQYLPAHPVVKTIQRRIDQLKVSAVVAAQNWEQAAQAREDALGKSLDDAVKSEQDLMGSEAEYKSLQDKLNGLNTSNDEVKKKVSEINLSKGTGALNISVLDTAEIDPKLTKPARPKTLGIAIVLGLICGLGFACLRDWTDDRLRTQQAVQIVIGAPVLAAIPAITTAHTAADRGQIVHHDPFGDAAESYRYLRTALQFGLPPGTKTLLITSPVSGDGKSTLISNLGITLAQAGKRILIVDADFRAPMQHRLFDLKDEIGLATVIGGTDTIDQAIQHTEMERLDVLPCGPIPSNPAEMLNDPAFLEQLNDLADKYDLILIDSPPVTAVTDARILAASVDASMLVVRPMTSTRKQAEAARDGLRSVGARLIGVAVNCVPRNGNFGGASGYYPPRTEPLAPARRRTPVADDDEQVNPMSNS